ncbi:hypothetical protein CK203_107193 [Vitis vinifera]|uniref:Uncharacterized protein n=1 Tax=Vitis vinifera TaxID=29760 RepID=A0A438DBJ7_VITVI|nr:hypothetical protein CK203_107193 [Vitis vinifera]
MVGRLFWLVMMPLGGGRAIITLQAADRDRGRRRRLSEIVGGDLSSFLSFRSAGYVRRPDVIWRLSGCDVCECRVPLPEGVRIGEARHVSYWGNSDGANPDRNACHVSAGEGSLQCPLLTCPFCQASFLRLGSVLAFRAFSGDSVVFWVRLGFLLPPCTFCGLSILLWGRVKVWDGDAGSVSAPVSRMFANKEATSSSSSEQSGKVASGDVHTEKSVDKLNGREFRERFCIPNGVSVQLVDGEAVSIEKSEDNAIFFTKEQFNVGFWFPLPSLFKEFLHFTQIPPAYIHPNMVRVLMGCSILSMLFNLDLSLLEVLFIYSIKKGKNDIFSFVACLPSLQLVTSLLDSTKGAARGHVLVKGLWAGLTVHPNRQFAPKQSLKALGKERRGKVVEWVEKASFDRLNRLLILQRARGAVKCFSPRRISAWWWLGEHFVLKDLSFYAAVRKADARARKALLNEREEKRQERTLRKAPGDKRSAPTPPLAPARKKKKKALDKGKEIKLPTPPKEVVIPPPTFVKGIIIRTLDPSVLPFVSSGSEHIACLNGSGPSVPAARRLALLAEEATSVNQPGSPIRTRM